MKIYKALLKYGYSNFKLENLEYCDLENLVELLIQVLENNFDLKCNIRKDKNVHLIYICAESIPHLRGLIKDFMHPTMLYKLGL